MVATLQNALPGQNGVNYENNNTLIRASAKRMNSESIGSEKMRLCGFGFFDVVGKSLAHEVARRSETSDCLFTQCVPHHWEFESHSERLWM